MREMKDSGIEWIGIIPSDWKISRIKYVATFINGDRGIKSIYLSCYLHYLRFVHTNAWSEYRHTASGVCADHCIHSLARYLTKALTCDKGLDILFLAYSLCYLHHKSSHQDSEKLLRAVISQKLLDLRKRHAEEVDITAVSSDYLGKLFNFHLRSV